MVTVFDVMVEKVSLTLVVLVKFDRGYISKSYVLSWTDMLNPLNMVTSFKVDNVLTVTGRVKFCE